MMPSCAYSFTPEPAIEDEIRLALEVYDHARSLVRDAEHNLDALRRRYADENGLKMRPRIEWLRQEVGSR